MARRSVLLAALVLAGLALPARPGEACSCIKRSPCSLYASTNAVFIGEVLDVHEDATRQTARIRVTQVWKGEIDEIVSVDTSPDTIGNCSADFHPGERRLVYARQSSQGLSTSLCAGGGVIAPGRPDPAPPTPGTVTGEVIRMRSDYANLKNRDDALVPMAGVTIAIETAAGRVETRSDARGQFVLNGIDPGKHELLVDLGPAEEASNPFVTLESPADCATAYISPRPAGRLAGTVVDAEGRALPGVDVVVVPADHDWSRWGPHVSAQATTDARGMFEAKALPAGRYYLGVNLFFPAKASEPYPPTFFPGVDTPDAATIVDVGRAPAMQAEPFVLRTRLPLIDLIAEVRCRDGSRPFSANLEAALVDPHALSPEYAYQPTGGRYVVHVLRGGVYDLTGRVAIRVSLPNGQTGTTAQRTDTQRVDLQHLDAGMAPPIVQLVAPIDHCDVEGGPLIERHD